MPTELHETLTALTRQIVSDTVVAPIPSFLDESLRPVVELLMRLSVPPVAVSGSDRSGGIDYSRDGRTPENRSVNRAFPTGDRFLTCRAATDVVLLLIVTARGDYDGVGAWYLLVEVVLHPQDGPPLSFTRETYQDEAAWSWPVVQAALEAVEARYLADPEYNCGQGPG